jgi:DNA-binding phage protein
LALEDALRSGDIPAFLRVFEAVSLARGLDRIGRDAGIEREALSLALREPEPDIPFFALLVEKMRKRCCIWARWRAFSYGSQA